MLHEAHSGIMIWSPPQDQPRRQTGLLYAYPVTAILVYSQSGILLPLEDAPFRKYKRTKDLQLKSPNQRVYSSDGLANKKAHGEPWAFLFTSTESIIADGA